MEPDLERCEHTELDAGRVGRGRRSLLHGALHRQRDDHALHLELARQSGLHPTGVHRWLLAVPLRGARFEVVRAAQYPYFQGVGGDRVVQGLDGDVAFNVATNGNANRVFGGQANARRAEYFRHPLTLVRAPDGMRGKSFYVRHAGDWAPRELRQVSIPDGTGSGSTMIADNVAGLVALAQMNVLEIHAWNARVATVRPSTADSTDSAGVIKVEP